MSQRSTPAPSVSTLMDEANLTVLPKPFKIPNKTLSRRSKSKKQMIQLERDAALGVVVGKKGRKSVPKPPTSGNGARGLSVLDRPGKPRLVGAAAARANQRLARQARLAQQQTPADDEGDAETASNLDMDASVADADQLVTPTPEGAEREATPTSALALDDEMLDTEPERPKDLAQYWNIDAPPSLRANKKYCDVTGLKAPYTDPRSRMRYHNAEVYDLIRSFGPGLDQAYLELRGERTTI